MPWRAAGQRLAIEVVRRLGGREARVLADRPRPHRVHRRLRAADVGRKAGQRVGRRQRLQVGGGVERLDDDAVGRVPVERVDVAAGRRARSGGTPGGERGGVGRRKAASRRRIEGSVGAIIAVAAATIPAMPRPTVSLIAAVARGGGIGRAGDLLVRLPGRPAALEADHDGRADRDGPKDLAIGRPRTARAAQHRRDARSASQGRRRRDRALARRGARSRGRRADGLSSSVAPRSMRSRCRSPTSCC